MARNEHLPIYQAAHDLCLWLEQVVGGFSRYQKYAIGSDLREGSRRILRLVASCVPEAPRVVGPPGLTTPANRPILHP